MAAATVPGPARRGHGDSESVTGRCCQWGGAGSRPRADSDSAAADTDPVPVAQRAGLGTRDSVPVQVLATEPCQWLAAPPRRPRPGRRQPEPGRRAVTVGAAPVTDSEYRARVLRKGCPSLGRRSGPGGRQRLRVGIRHSRWWLPACQSW